MTWLDCLNGNDSSTQNCWKSGLSGWITLFSFSFCCIQTYFLFLRKQKFLSYQLLALYMSCGQTFIASLYYFFFDETILQYVRLFVEQNVFLVVALYFSRFALRSLQGDEDKERKLYTGFIFLYIVSLTILLGCSFGPRAFQCHDRLWLGLALLQLFISIILLISGLLIWRRVGRMIVSKGVKNSKRVQLWSLIIIWMISASYSVTFQLYVSFTYPDEDSCKDFFDLNKVDNWVGRMILLVITYIISSLMPIWAMSIIFYSINSSRPQKSNSYHSVHDYLDYTISND